MMNPSTLKYATEEELKRLAELQVDIAFKEAGVNQLRTKLREEAREPARWAAWQKHDAECGRKLNRYDFMNDTPMLPEGWPAGVEEDAAITDFLDARNEK